MPTPPAVVLDDVVKRFGALTAVDHLAPEVPVGTCFGLLGPNGAGKSTTMRLLTGQAVADSGEVRLLGHRLPRDSKAARARCGVVPQVDNLDTDGGAPATTAAVNGAGMFDGERVGRRRAATLEDVFVVLTGEELV